MRGRSWSERDELRGGVEERGRDTVLEIIRTPQIQVPIFAKEI